MQGCNFGLRSQLRVGLQKIGLVGWQEALHETTHAELASPETIIDSMIEKLTVKNYIPDSQNPELRKALWREYQRFLGNDISELFSEVQVTIRGFQGDKSEQFTEILISVFSDYELKPIITYQKPSGDDIYPQLLLHGEPIIKGILPRRSFKLKVQKYLSHW